MYEENNKIYNLYLINKNYYYLIVNLMIMNLFY